MLCSQYLGAGRLSVVDKYCKSSYQKTIITIIFPTCPTTWSPLSVHQAINPSIIPFYNSGAEIIASRFRSRLLDVYDYPISVHIITPQGASKPVAAARGLWTALQASVIRMQYLGNSRTWGSHSRSRHTVWAGLGKIFELSEIGPEQRLQ